MENAYQPELAIVELLQLMALGHSGGVCVCVCRDLVYFALCALPFLLLGPGQVIALDSEPLC